MKLSFANDRVLAVMAHPDDAELLCAGTLARAKQDSAAIAICVMCCGDKGIPRGQDAHAATDTAKCGVGFQPTKSFRHIEAESASNLLGAELFWFSAPDGELFDTYDNRKKLIEIYRQFSPTLIITHAPEDYHPDHRATSALAEAASWFASSRGHLTQSQATAFPPALWFADTINAIGFNPEIYIEISAHLEIKQKMLAAHRSQLERGKDSDFSPLNDLMLAQAKLRGSQSGALAAEAFRAHHAFKRVHSF